MPLPQALSRLAMNVEQARLRVHLALPDRLAPLPDTHRLALYRAAQEALTNVQRHARTREVWIELEMDEKTVALSIRDDGIGFDAQEKHAGFGLLGMHERAVQLGGELTIQSRLQGRTQLVFRLPLPAEIAYA